MKQTRTDDDGITTTIAILWSAEDVIGIANEENIQLTKEQVGDILDQLLHKHDAIWGICWETIRTIVSEYRISGLKLDKDFIFEYKGYGNCESKCRVRTITDPDIDEIMVLITELEDNPGTSVTNRIEEIVHSLIVNLGFEYYKTIWIEHYDNCTISNNANTFDYVEFDYSEGSLTNPKWRRASSQLADSILKII